MSNAGYGNHEAEPVKVAERPAAAEAGRKPGPDSQDPTSPSSSGDRRDVATPGDGAGPTAPQGDEVDPGVG